MTVRHTFEYSQALGRYILAGSHTESQLHCLVRVRQLAGRPRSAIPGLHHIDQY